MRCPREGYKLLWFHCLCKHFLSVSERHHLVFYSVQDQQRRMVALEDFQVLQIRLREKEGGVQTQPWVNLAANAPQRAKAGLQDEARTMPYC